MTEWKHTYIAIDLKSFYASVECQELGLDPLTDNLVVADVSRTEKTICLAVSPSLKSYGIPGRARLFEVIQAVKQENARRRNRIGGKAFTGSSVHNDELQADPYLELDFVAARPRMQKYMDISSSIYQVYLRYIAPEDIHVYSIDEVFMDVTSYLKTYQMSAHELAMKMIHEVLDLTGITATAGIAPNLFLCKVAMDVVAKHIPADADGVRIAELDEASYRRTLWNHRPLTDFWRVGKGIASKLERNGMQTMGDIAQTAYRNEDLLYRLFGVNAETLIDHAFGVEPCGMADIKNYRPRNHSLSQGQVLSCAYTAEKGKLVVREMTDQLVLDLVRKRLVTDQISLMAGYDIDNMTDPALAGKYQGEMKKDWYGRELPKMAHGSENLPFPNSSTRMITEAMMRLYDRIVNKELMVRRFYVVANNVIPEDLAGGQGTRAGKLSQMAAAAPDGAVAEPAGFYEQMDLFTDYAARREEEEQQEEKLQREKRAQQAVLDIQKKFGKNAILKGMNLQEGATARERNQEIGGHRA